MISSDTCQRWYGGNFHKQTMLCAGHAAGGKDACLADSGGPLQCLASDGRWKLTGIVSFGETCAEPRKPGIYTRVETMVGWMKSHLEGIQCIRVFYIRP